MALVKSIAMPLLLTAAGVILGMWAGKKFGLI